MTSFLPGFALSLSLILAIGAQNAFVLRQGLRRQHVFWVCLLCGLFDTILIVAGVAGFGTLASKAPWFEPMMRYGGAAFLLWYGLRSFQSAWRGVEALEVASGQEAGLKTTLLTVMGLTWLNPHVYLDTLILIGSVSSQYADKVAFASGAIAASVIFFFALGYGARLLAPVFARSVAWRILDVIIGCTMCAIALKLLVM